MNRWNGKCPKCKHVVSLLGSVERAGRRAYLVTGDGARYDVWHRPGMESTISVPCPTCVIPVYGGTTPRSFVLRRVRGRTNPVIMCDARCEGATGHTCECSCGGKNHGAAHGAA